MASASGSRASAGRSAEVICRDGQIVQGHGQTGRERFGALLRELAVDGDGFLGLRQRFLAAAELGEQGGQMVQGCCQIGQEGFGVLVRQLPVEV